MSCKICLREHNEQNREKRKLRKRKTREIDTNNILICNIRNRTRQAFKSQNVKNIHKTFNLMGCSNDFFPKMESSSTS